MTANEVYDILVKEAGAPEADRADFAQWFGRTSEWRFQGWLGFGGKFYYGSNWIAGRPVNDKMRVDCYLEDKNQTRSLIIKQVNELLSEVGHERHGENGVAAGGD